MARAFGLGGRLLPSLDEAVPLIGNVAEIAAVPGSDVVPAALWRGKMTPEVARKAADSGVIGWRAQGRILFAVA